MRINNNISALNTHRNLGVNGNAASKAMEKLSSGMRINRAADDAAGLSISEKMRAQLRGMEAAQRNAQDGISYIQTAEGALDEVSSILTRMKELTVQKANGTYNADDKNTIELELEQLTEELGNIASNTKFNEVEIFNPATPAINIALSHDGVETLKIEPAELTKTLDLTKTSGADEIDAAVKEVTQQRAKYGAAQNRLEHTIKNLAATHEILSAAESRIRDTDMAAEMMEFTRANILNQAAQSMLAQANQLPQGVLQLLK